MRVSCTPRPFCSCNEVFRKNIENWDVVPRRGSNPRQRATLKTFSDKPQCTSRMAGVYFQRWRESNWKVRAPLKMAQSIDLVAFFFTNPDYLTLCVASTFVLPGLKDWRTHTAHSISASCVPKVQTTNVGTNALVGFRQSPRAFCCFGVALTMLMLLVKGLVGKKVTLLKRVQFMIMFLGAATILLFQVGSSIFLFSTINC